VSVTSVQCAQPHTVPPWGILTLRHMDTPSLYRTYTVTGMTCNHCVMSVREEVGEIAGITDIDVDLASGRLAVAGADISDDAVKAAVAEAGYEVIA